MNEISPRQRDATSLQRPTQNYYFTTDHKLYRLVLPIIAGVLSAVAGIFLTLAAGQVVPHGVNAISNWGAGGYVLGGGLIGVGLFITTLTLACKLRNRSAAHPPPTVPINLNPPAQPSTTTSQPDLPPQQEPLPNPPFPHLASTPAAPLLPKCIPSIKFEEFLAYRTQSPTTSFGVATGTSFFHYRCDTYDDYSWGCAWRCILMIASVFGRFFTLDAIYDQFHPEEPLNTRIARGHQGVWAEPGTCKEYLDQENIPNQLMLYNKERGTSLTQTELCTKISGFPALRDALVEHFSKYSTPVMIDDVAYTFNILGIRVLENGETILFIGDPHKTDYDSGLYYAALDQEGHQIATTGIDNGRNGMMTAQKIFFNGKGWMLLFPQPDSSPSQH